MSNSLGIIAWERGDLAHAEARLRKANTLWANSPRLQGGLFTRDLQRAFLALETWDVGGLMINDVPIYRIDNMPFGGWKQSGTGREGTRYAMDEMSEIKLLVITYS